MKAEDDCLKTAAYGESSRSATCSVDELLKISWRYLGIPVGLLELFFHDLRIQN